MTPERFNVLQRKLLNACRVVTLFEAGMIAGFAIALAVQAATC